MPAALFESKNMRSRLLEKSDRAAVILIVLYVLLLVALPLLLDRPDIKRIFSEDGPFETLSVAAWIFAAAVTLAVARMRGLTAWVFGLLFLAFAAREADWHKKFTADSLLKSNYYRHTEAPFGEKLVAGIVALVFIAMIVYAGFAILRFLLREQGWRSRAGAWLLAGAALIVLGKLLDRAPAELAEAGYALGEAAQLFSISFEEGMEMIHPLIFAWAAWLCRSGQSFLAGPRAARSLFIRR